MSTLSRFINAYKNCPRNSVLSNYMLHYDKKLETPISREVLEMNDFHREESVINENIEYYSFEGINIIEHNVSSDEWCLFGHYIKLKNLIDVENILDLVGIDIELKTK